MVKQISNDSTAEVDVQGSLGKFGAKVKVFARWFDQIDDALTMIPALGQMVSVAGDFTAGGIYLVGAICETTDKLKQRKFVEAFKEALAGVAGAAITTLPYVEQLDTGKSVIMLLQSGSIKDALSVQSTAEKVEAAIKTMNGKDWGAVAADILVQRGGKAGLLGSFVKKTIGPRDNPLKDLTTQVRAGLAPKSAVERLSAVADTLKQR